MKLPYPIAERTVKHYVCAHCWGNLTRTRIDHESDDVFCQSCGDTGFITRNYADGRRGESSAELAEVLNLMYEAGEMDRPERQTTNQILSNLGF